MTEQELQRYLLQRYPAENARCEWKEMKNLKNSFNGKEGDDVVSYVSAIANMEGGELVIGVKSSTLEIVGTDLSKLTFNGEQGNPQNATYKLVQQCINLSSEGLCIEEFVTSNSHKTVWVIHIPKHKHRLPVYVHGKAWQRIADSLVEKDCPESRYRNPFLMEAMCNVGMAETEGGGIKKLFVEQRKRFFPMPSYTLTDKRVRCEIQGNVLDENFARILVNNPSLSLPEIILLDKVQMKRYGNLTNDAIALLRKKGFVEGRKTNLYLSYKVVETSKHIGLKASYIKNKSFDDSYYKKLIIDYLKKFKSASRKEMDALLVDKLPDVLDETQKYNKVTNLLASLRKEGQIYSKGRVWFLYE